MMVIEIRTNTPKPKADVAQRKEQGSSKAKVEGSNPSVSTNVHTVHCNQGDYLGSCKYGDDDCPAIIRPKQASDEADGPYDTRGVADALFPDLTESEIDRMIEAWTNGVVLKHEKRLAYNAAYQRDLRTIKRLGLEMTVKQYRESLK